MANDTRTEGSHFGKSFRFQGDISGAEDLFVDGTVDGTIQLSGQVVTIGPAGSVNADVQARDLVVHGKLKGNAKASDRIEVSRTGSVLGDLAMARIAIQDGAFIQGRVDIRAVGGAAPLAPAGAVAAASGPNPAGGLRPQQPSFLDPKL